MRRLPLSHLLPDSLCLRVLAAVGTAYLPAIILWQNRRYAPTS